MIGAEESGHNPAAALTRSGARLRLEFLTTLPAMILVALMIVWAVHDGGYDSDTWYWGALLTLALLAIAVIGRPVLGSVTTRAERMALACFGLYVAWSYLSIAWAQSPGDALLGSNRALLYLTMYAVMVALRWTPKAALGALLTFAIGIGVVAAVLLFRLSFGSHVSTLVIGGRLAAPTGYFNSTAALFTMAALTAIALAARRELPSVVRALLLALACGGLQLAVIPQSRGWLFTLPLVTALAIAAVRGRLRTALFALLPVAGALVPIHRLLAVYRSGAGPGLERAALDAGRTSLKMCAAVLVVGLVAAMADRKLRIREPSAAVRRIIGTAAVVGALAGVALGWVAVSHGDPIGFVKRQWHGFSHPQAGSTSPSGSHFADVGSARYDVWRVSLDAFAQHPLGGLGQDNFADYYVAHRRTGEQPQSTHSLEMRLLAETGLIGALLFAAFLAAAIAAALGGRRRGSELGRAMAGAALIPAIVWLIHGSVDWFWEVPALSGPALGFLAVAGALGRTGDESLQRSVAWRAPALLAAALGFAVAVVVLALPYLSVREVSVANDIRASDPGQALRALSTASRLNPLSADPGRIGGTIALQAGLYTEAERRFGQAVSREPGGWYGWLGRGLAASALGQRAVARSYFARAASIIHDQPVVDQALADVYSAHPLRPAEALQLLAAGEA